MTAALSAPDFYARAYVRALMVECVRGGLPADAPEVIRAASAVAWHVESWVRPGRAAALAQEAARRFDVPHGAARAMAREASDVDLQRRIEEVVLAGVEPFWLGRYARVEGLAAADPPALLVGLGAPHPLLCAYALAVARPGLVALHGLCTAAEAPCAADRWLRERFTEWRERLPVTWEADPACVGAVLRSGRPVYAVVQPQPGAGGVGLDDPTVLGRPLTAVVASLPPGTPVRAALVHRERDKRWWVEVTPPLVGAALVDTLSAHVRRWPAQVLSWLSAARD